MNKVKLLVLFSLLLVLSSCSLKGYMGHLFGGKEKVENSICFLQDEYVVSKSGNTKVYIRAELEDYSYLEKISFSIDNSKYGSISNEGIITPNTDFVEGTTTIRARIDELKIEAFASVCFTESSLKISGISLDNVKKNNIVIDASSKLKFVSDKSINYNDFEINFMNDYVTVEESNDGFQIKSDVLGKMDYYVTFKNTQKIVYRGSLYSTLYDEVVESRARLLLSKEDNEIITKEELASIVNLDDGSCFVSKGIKSFSDFKYFPLTTSLNVSNNKISELDLNMDNLKYLNASNNKISNIVFPQNNSNIIKLDISNSGYNLSKFDDSKLTKLEILNVNSNYSSTNTFSLNGNDKFNYLNCGNCSLEKISLGNKTNFQYLIAPGNKLTNLSGFTTIGLKVVDIANNKVNSLSFLKYQEELTELYIGGNPIPSSELAYINKNIRSNITRLNLSITGTINLDDIKSFIYDCRESLTWLQIYGMGLTDISWISKDIYPKLEYIKVSHNSITNYSSLEGISVIVKDYNDKRQDV